MNAYPNFSLVQMCYNAFQFLLYVICYRPSLLWRLELREDGYRCRQKVLPNLHGSHHLDAVRVTNEAEQMSRSVPEAAGIAIAVTSAGPEDDLNQSLSEDPTAGETPLSSLEVSLTGGEEGEWDREREYSDD